MSRGPGQEAPLRVGVLGAARIAGLAIGEPAAATGARLVAIAARDRGRAEVFAERYGVERVHDTYDAVLADPEVDVVYNPLPNGMHGPWNVRAVAAGKHVLSEKPFASNAAEAVEVAGAARAAGVSVVEAFHYVFHPVAVRVLQAVAGAEVGRVRRVETTVSIPAPPDGDPRWALELAGGAMMDLGCYGLHAHRMLAPWAGGEPRVVDSRAGERAGHAGVDEWLDVELSFPGGAAGHVRCDMNATEREMTWRVEGDAGAVTATSFVLPNLDDRVVVERSGSSTEERCGTRSSYTYQLEALADHLRTQRPLPVGADDAVRTMRLVDAAYNAAGLPPRPRLTLDSDLPR